MVRGIAHTLWRFSIFKNWKWRKKILFDNKLKKKKHRHSINFWSGGDFMIKFWRLFFGVVMMALPCFILAETVNFPVEIPYPVYENVNGVVRLIDVNTDEIIDSLNVTIAPGQEEAEYSFQFTSTDNEIEFITS